jgi:predicted dithiol-disulfide oxidoreductase (DUF899 family)
MLENHKVVLHREWIEARKELLKKEKEFTRLRDQLSQWRRDLPWERVEKGYVFEGSNGKENLSDLFDGRSQLIVYHFMFAPDWDAGCPHCSHWADNFDRVIVHLNQRDVTMIAVSRAPYSKLIVMKGGWAGASNGFHRSRATLISITRPRLRLINWRKRMHFTILWSRTPAFQSVRV